MIKFNFLKETHEQEFPKKKISVEVEKPSGEKLLKLLELKKDVDNIAFDKIKTKEEATSSIIKLIQFLNDPFVDSIDAKEAPNPVTIPTLWYFHTLKKIMFNFKIAEAEVNTMVGEEYFTQPLDTPYTKEFLSMIPPAKKKKA